MTVKVTDNGTIIVSTHHDKQMFCPCCGKQGGCQSLSVGTYLELHNDGEMVGEWNPDVLYCSFCRVHFAYFSASIEPENEQLRYDPAQTCKNCGDSVRLGSGKFVNRIPDANDYETRVANGDPYPHGEFLCYECECEIIKDGAEVICPHCHSGETEFLTKTTTFTHHDTKKQGYVYQCLNCPEWFAIYKT